MLCCAPHPEMEGVACCHHVQLQVSLLACFVGTPGPSGHVPCVLGETFMCRLGYTFCCPAGERSPGTYEQSVFMTECCG